MISAMSEVNSLVTFLKVDLLVFRTSTAFSVEQTVSPVVGSVAQVVIVALPPGLPRPRAQTS